MISTVFSVFLFVLATSESRSVAEIKQWMMSQAMSCTTEVPITSEEQQMLLAHKMPDSKNAKCFTACIFKKVGWLNDKGVYDETEVLKFAADEYADDTTKLEAAKKLYGICKTVNEITDGPEACERAFSLSKCLIENAPEVGFELDVL